MLLHHFERLRPVCPVCRLGRSVESPLRLGQIAKEVDGEILEGTLICSNLQCQREHPILDGIPIILVDAPSWLQSQLLGILRRDDLTPFTESLLGDLGGQGSALDRDRGNNSIYADAHWGQEPSAYMELFRAVQPLMSSPAKGVWLDIGCSVGRGTAELARMSGDLAVGLDLNFSMLRIAQRIRREHRVRYSKRRVGLVFDPVDYDAPDLAAEQMSFWCADVAMIPFSDATFAGSIAMNMLDCAQSPLGLLLEMGRVTARGSESILCTPFDWAVGASAPADWIGGHSQRLTPQQGSSVAELQRILSADRAAGVDTGLQIEAELDRLRWRLRLHERSVTEYEVYCARLRRNA
jgi:SAM-dependent methyltransferase/uncharacterized protein YbaR (Trm112 family)